MTADEIRKLCEDKIHWPAVSVGDELRLVCLREIAAQLAELNQTLRGIKARADFDPMEAFDAE